MHSTNSNQPRRARLLLPGACALAGLLLLLWWGLRSPTTAPGSIKVLAQKVAAGDPKALEALNNLGSNAVPELANLLSYRDPFFRVQAWNLISQSPKPWRHTLSAKLSPLESPGIRVAAAKSLAVLGPDAAAAVPDLVVALHDPEPFVAMQAAAALGRIGKPAVPGLTNALANKRPAVRHAAAYGLGEVGGDAEAAVPQLITRLEDYDPAVASSSAYSLTLIGNQVVAGLSNRIAQADSPQRQSAIQELIRFDCSLCSIATSATKLEPAKADNLGNIGLQVLGFVRATDHAVLKILVHALDDPAPRVRVEALKALSQLNWHTPPVLEALRKLLTDPSAEVRECAARNLGDAGSAATLALGDLNRALQDPQVSVRAAAREAIEKIGSKGEGANKTGTQ